MEVDDDAVLAKILVEEGTANVKIGSLIAMTVEEGQDWKDVQIPTQESEEAPDISIPAVKTSPEEVHVSNVPGVGPATNLLLTQYGIKAG